MKRRSSTSAASASRATATRGAASWSSTKRASSSCALPYDVDTTVKKVEAIADLDNFLGTRLLDGTIDRATSDSLDRSLRGFD